MSRSEHEVLSDLIRQFLDEQLERSPAMRRLARHLATLTLERLDELEDTEQRASAPPPEPPAPPKAQQPTAIAPLRIGDAEVHVPVPGDAQAVEAAHEAAQAPPPRPQDEDDYLERTAGARSIDLTNVVERCRLKARSCRHQILRQHQEHNTPEEVESRELMKSLIAQAKAMPNCFLWMFYRGVRPTRDGDLKLIASCYDVMADAAELCQTMEPLDQYRDDERVREALQLLSTACSALRVALTDTWLTQPDKDQEEVHQWLKLVTAEHRYHVRRHMQLHDPADPSVDVPAAAERARLLLAERRDLAERSEQAQRLLKKALYHAEKVRDVVSSPFADEQPTHDCKKINEAIDALIALDPPELDATVRQLTTIIGPDDFPSDITPHPRLVSAATPVQIEPKPRRERTAEGRERSWSEDVGQVRELLRGSQLVVIGGEPRRDAMDRMTDAFDLASVAWPELTEHGPAEPMRAPIANPSTRLVVILIKLTGHEHADRAREFARQASVPFIHMPAGYNPEQIAAEVLKQASGQLRTA
ncbi:MAG: hypothetical protein RIB58_09905 [Phycisphaerales bacterium]